jgi:hypothetical protein
VCEPGRVIAWAVGGFRDVAGGRTTFAGDARPTPSEANASKAVRSRREAAFFARRGAGGAPSGVLRHGRLWRPAQHDGDVVG